MRFQPEYEEDLMSCRIDYPVRVHRPRLPAAKTQLMDGPGGFNCASVHTSQLYVDTLYIGYLGHRTRLQEERNDRDDQYQRSEQVGLIMVVRLLQARIGSGAARWQLRLSGPRHAVSTWFDSGISALSLLII